jgi:general secretion pathway protein M
MLETIKNYWKGLSRRDQQILMVGVPVIGLILFWGLLYQPMKDQIQAYQKALPQKRIDLAWLRQQQSQFSGDSQVSGQASDGRSIIAIIEQTAQNSGVKQSIQSLSPGATKNEARLLLSEADFNKWLKWSDVLAKDHQVKVKRLTVQKEDAANIAEIRVTFER